MKPVMPQKGDEQKSVKSTMGYTDLTYLGGA